VPCRSLPQEGVGLIEKRQGILLGGLMQVSTTRPPEGWVPQTIKVDGSWSGTPI